MSHRLPSSGSTPTAEVRPARRRSLRLPVPRGEHRATRSAVNDPEFALRSEERGFRAPIGRQDPQGPPLSVEQLDHPGLRPDEGDAGTVGRDAAADRTPGRPGSERTRGPVGGHPTSDAPEISPFRPRETLRPRARGRKSARDAGCHGPRLSAVARQPQQIAVPVARRLDSVARGHRSARSHRRAPRQAPRSGRRRPGRGGDTPRARGPGGAHLGCASAAGRAGRGAPSGAPRPGRGVRGVHQVQSARLVEPPAEQSAEGLAGVLDPGYVRPPEGARRSVAVRKRSERARVCPASARARGSGSMEAVPGDLKDLRAPRRRRRIQISAARVIRPGCQGPSRGRGLHGPVSRLLPDDEPRDRAARSPAPSRESAGSVWAGPA